MKYVIALICFAVLTACSEDENLNEQIPDNIESELTISDIKGVWVLKDNPLYFISLSESGFYSFCFNEKLMGGGNYVLNENEVTLNNGYSYMSDKLKLDLNEDILTVRGAIQLLYQGGSSDVNLVFIKSNETISPSIVGIEREPQLYGVNKFYDDIRIVVSYVSNYNAKYEYSGVLRSTGRRKIIKSYSWYYVYRQPYTYTQEIEGDGSVVIYNFDNNGPDSSLENNLVPQN